MATKSFIRCSKGEDKDQVKWDDNKIKMFLKLCVEEINARNKLGTYFSREGQIYKKSFNNKGAYDKTKSKNKWNILKIEFTPLV